MRQDPVPGSGNDFVSHQSILLVSETDTVEMAAWTEATSPIILITVQPEPLVFSRPTSVMEAAFAMTSAQLMANARPLTSSNPSDCFTLCSLANGVMPI